MGNKLTCCAKVYPSGMAFPMLRACGNLAKVEHEGRYYCKLHYPPRVAEKRAARDEKSSREYEEKRRARRIELAAPAMLEALELCMFALGRGGANVEGGPNRKEWEAARAAIKCAVDKS